MAKIEWETRAKERSLENKRLKKKIKEVTIGRESWKSKAMERKATIDDLNKKLEIVKKNLQQIIGL